MDREFKIEYEPHWRAIGNYVVYMRERYWFLGLFPTTTRWDLQGNFKTLEEAEFVAKQLAKFPINPVKD